MTNPSYPLVSFGLDDTNVKNAISSFSQYNPYTGLTNTNCFVSGIQTVVPYATFESNFWVLDGTYHFMPANPLIGFLGYAPSDSSGNFTRQIGINVQFSSVQSLTSLTLHFDKPSNNWCSSVEIDFLDISSATIYTTTVSPTGVDFTLNYSVSGCKSITITLITTNNPYRFARLTAFDFGTITHLDGTKIKSARITEEFSPISQTLTANKFDLELLLDNADFDVLNPSSPYVNLPSGMPFSVYEVVDNVTNQMGVFFLDTWDNSDSSNRVVKFECLDAIGLAAKLPFYGWVTNVRDFITIMTYALSSVSNITFTGDAGVLSGNYKFASIFSEGTEYFSFFEPSSLRDFIQKVCMAFHLGVTTRNGKLYFFSTDNVPYRLSLGDQSYNIAITQESIKKTSLLPITSGIKLVRKYSTSIGGGTSIVTAYTQSLAAGDYIITFDAMRSGSVSISGGTLNTPTNWEVVGNFAYDFNVAAPGTVTIQDWGRMEDEPGNVYKTIVTFVTLIANAPTDKYIEVDTTAIASSSVGYIANANLYDQCQANWIGDYFRGRYYQECTVYSIIVHAGDMVLVDSAGTKKILGFIEEASIDLMGLRSDIRVVGTVQ